MTSLVGVLRLPLTPHADDRGVFTELYRAEWDVIAPPAQWSLVRSRARVLRGVHLHVRHDDYLVPVAGAMHVAVRDLRQDSPTHGETAVIVLDAEEDPAGLVVPAGVAHGFWFPAPAAHVYAVTEAWNPSEEMGCRWDDPGLGFHWAPVEPIVSPRDAALPSLDELVARYADPARWRDPDSS